MSTVASPKQMPCPTGTTMTTGGAQATPTTMRTMTRPQTIGGRDIILDGCGAQGRGCLRRGQQQDLRQRFQQRQLWVFVDLDGASRQTAP